MKNKKALYAILFVLSCTFVGFWLGCVVGALFFMPPNPGLAGGAIVFMYGLGGMALSLFSAVWLSSKWTEPELKKAKTISLTVVAATLVLVAVRVLYLNAA